MIPLSASTLPVRTTPLARAACAYVALGFAVTPVHGVTDDGACMCSNTKCGAPGKHPVGQTWQKRAARTVDDARDLFDGHIGNLGLYLGDTGFVVLDFDGEAGLRTRDELLAGNMLPRTLTARSGSGGEHRVYRFASRHDAATVTDRRVGFGWDVKRSGQFLAAPSRHACGGYYEWVDDAPIAELPDDLFSRIQRVRDAMPAPGPAATGDVARRARAYVDKMPPAIAGAGGHDATFAVARKLVQDFGLGASDAWSILCDYNRRCEPPWAEHELKHKLVSAQKAHTRNPIPNRPRLTAVRGPASPPDEPPYGGGGGGDDGGGSGGSGGGAPAPDWRANLLWTESRTGKPKLVVHHENVVRILQLHESWRGKLKWDEFRGRIVFSDAPWSDFHRPTFGDANWADEDATRLAGWLRTEFHQWAFAPSVSDCERAVDVVARANAWHPVRDYLDSLTWDNTLRLSTMGATYFGTEANDYSANVFRWWMISAVARILSPGCKADHVLILEGRQGAGKSTALRVLAGDWFSDTPIDLNSKDAYSQVRGKWIVELAELDSLFKAEASRAKAFFSSPKDDYRPAYGRREREQLRQCVFAGSVNEGTYLKDPTGARRFWPVLCGRLDAEALRRDRDQLWAEAAWWYREGARWWPESHETATLEAEQEFRSESDEWTSKIESYLPRAGGAVTTGEILEKALAIEAKDWTRANQTRVGVIMIHGLHWKKHRQRHDGGLRWVYARP